jgi:hypothetical protein
MSPSQLPPVTASSSASGKDVITTGRAPAAAMASAGFAPWKVPSLGPSLVRLKPRVECSGSANIQPAKRLIVALTSPLDRPAGIYGPAGSPWSGFGFKIPSSSRMPAKCATAPSLTGNWSGGHGCTIFGRFRPVRIVRKRGAIPD